MNVDLLFSASSRPEFTIASLRALSVNTDWSLVRKLWLYIDDPDPGTHAAVVAWINYEGPPPLPGVLMHCGRFGGPVAIMNHWLDETATAGEGLVLAKIDNDVIVPPGWLNAAAGVMDRHQELDILGLEPPQSRTAAPWANGKRPPAPELLLMDAVYREARYSPTILYPEYAPCDAIGGVGLMRRRAFANRPRMIPHSTYGGFTDWQLASPDLVNGWIVPPLALFLLDRLPVEPWATLSRQYIAAGQQRPWTNYDPGDHQLWDWWLSDEALLAI